MVDVCADRVRPKTQVSQCHGVTINTRVEQSVNHTGNEASTLIPPRVKKEIYADIRPLFTCVLRCHTRSPKVEGRNLLISYSVAGAKLPAYWLANPNVLQLLILGHLPTAALPKRLALSSHGGDFPKGIIPQQSVHSANGKLFGGRFSAHSYSALPDMRRMKKYFAIISLCSDDFLRMEKKENLYSIIQQIIMVW